MKTNKDLKDLYDSVYKSGEENFFTFDMNEEKFIVLALDIYDGKKILDVGCGTGETAFGLIKKNAKSVLAIDYSREAIKIAKKKHNHEKIRFEHKSYEEVEEKFDVIVILGTLEHMDDPFKALEKLKSLLNKNGKIVITCPSFLNIRGYIWMALLTLLDVPMSLTDLHYICPFDMEKWSNELGMDNIQASGRQWV